MDAVKSAHPSDQALRSFGLGKLDDSLATAIQEHLTGCPECRRRATEVTADTFLERLRNAYAAPASPRPALPLPAGVSSLGAEERPGEPPPISSLPPGLADHPDYEIIRELGRGGMGFDQWYDVRIEARGAECRCFLDGQLIFEDTDDRFTSGRIGFKTWESVSRFRDIEVTTPDGKLLWKGLPTPLPSLTGCS